MSHCGKETAETTALPLYRNMSVSFHMYKINNEHAEKSAYWQW
jgi:hypothetical protein